MRKLVIFAVLFFSLFAAPFISADESNGETCQELSEELNENIKDANYCKTDDDCKIVSFSCPYITCGAYVNSKEVDELEGEYKTFSDCNDDTTSIVCAACLESIKPICVEGKCVAFSEESRECTKPECVSAYETGEYDEEGCPTYKCGIYNEEPTIPTDCSNLLKKCKDGADGACEDYEEHCGVSIKPGGEPWYHEAYWQCYDGTEFKEGGEASCKPVETRAEYAKDACDGKCDEETGKCGVNTFEVFSECPGITIEPKPFCGNGLCEENEKEICEDDCKGDSEVNINERFTLKVGEEVTVVNDHEIEIKLLGIHHSGCAGRKLFYVLEPKESPESITGSVVEGVEFVETPFALTEITEDEEEDRDAEVDSSVASVCKGGELIANLRIGIEGEPHSFVSLHLGEKKKIVGGATIVFLDFFSSPGKGVFIVLDEINEQCPSQCICSADGSIECPEEECKFGYELCHDGTCQKSCKIDEFDECKFGCLYDEKSCFPIGTRFEEKFCSLSRDVEAQRESGAICENDFECATNSCLDGQCTVPGFWQKIFKWLDNFGLTQ